MFPLHNVPTDNSETKNVYSFICMGVGGAVLSSELPAKLITSKETQ